MGIKEKIVGILRKSTDINQAVDDILEVCDVKVLSDRVDELEPLVGMYWDMYEEESAKVSRLCDASEQVSMAAEYSSGQLSSEMERTLQGLLKVADESPFDSLEDVKSEAINNALEYALIQCHKNSNYRWDFLSAEIQDYASKLREQEK